MTAWYETFDDEAWRRWLQLLDLSPKLQRGLTIDPFGTSTRTFSTQLRPWLIAIANGTPVGSERRWQQTLIDARGIGLVHPGTEQLSEFGEAVLNCWLTLDLGDTFAAELPCAVAFVLKAIELRRQPQLDALGYWWDVRSLCGEAVLADDDALLLLPYINQELEGFNPWAELRNARVPLTGPLDWEAIKDAVRYRDAPAVSGLDRLRGKLDRRELRARVVYLRAMDLVFMRDDPAAVRAQLDVLTR